MDDNSDNEPDAEVEVVEPSDSGSEEGSREGEEEEQFDIALSATHSYMGGGLSRVGGRTLVEGGWRGRVPLLAAGGGGALFPGEIVPLLLPHPADADKLRAALARDKLFGLLAADESGVRASRYGTLCEVFEAEGGGGGGDGARGGGGGGGPLSVKARAVHRFVLAEPPAEPEPIHHYSRVREQSVIVLGEPRRGDPLAAARLPSLLARSRPADCAHQRLHAAGTPWPGWVFEQFHYERLRDQLATYFRTLNLEDKMPREPVSLSFWASSNLPLSARGRLGVLRAPDALVRLQLCARALPPPARALACTHCGAHVARAAHVFVMSSDGVHSNYTNLGGFLHDVVTVTECTNTRLSGSPNAEYSWFPGYNWTIAVCAGCSSHVGWRFTAQRRSLRPQQFYGLSRCYVEPEGGGD